MSFADVATSIPRAISVEIGQADRERGPPTVPQLKEANVYLGGNPGNAELVKGVLRERKGSK